MEKLSSCRHFELARENDIIRIKALSETQICHENIYDYYLFFSLNSYFSFSHVWIASVEVTVRFCWEQRSF